MIAQTLCGIIKEMEILVKDLIELPEVKTVIQFSDLQDPSLRKHLAESFILTEDVQKALISCLEALSSGRGKGIFLQGSFGSGKSHFLTVLNLLLSENWPWNPICRSEAVFDKFHSNLPIGQYLIVDVSLVNYRSWQRLEDIVFAELLSHLRALPEPVKGIWDYQSAIEPIASGIKQNFPSQLESFCREAGLDDPEAIFIQEHLSLLDQFIQQNALPYKLPYDRKELLRGLKELFLNQTKSGLIILIDELSEYLKSKSSGRAFNEDIRFLQFLGESSLELPVWIIASLQEWIEETGTLAQDSFRKIKDRYPLRLKLSGRHVEQIVSQRLIRKKEAASHALPQIYNSLRGALANFPYSLEEFKEFYPVHPATIRLLEEMRSLFAEHRGVVDFVHSRLNGDSIRNIPSFLENKADTLLTPDSIFDHFKVRIEDNLELSPFSQKVFRYFDSEVKTLFAQREDRELALRLIKLLILQAISGAPRKFAVESLAEMLFFKISDLDFAINYEYLREVLEKLYSGGAYLGVERGKEPFKDCYFVNLKDDLGLVIRRKCGFISQNLFPEDLRLVTQLLPYLDETFLPLSLLEFGGKNKRTVNWQRTLREGFLVLAPFTILEGDFLADLFREYLRSEADFLFFLGLPLGHEDRRFFQDEVLPKLKSADSLPVSFWLPASFSQESLHTLKEALSHLLLLEEYRQEETETAMRSRDHLRTLVGEDRERVREVYKRAYYQGEIISAQGEVLFSPMEKGYMAFPQVLNEVVGKLLEKQYPKHLKVAPATEVLTTGQLQEVIQTFFRNPSLSFDQTSSTAVRTALEGFLKPMNLLKREGSRFVLSLDPSRNDLVKLFLDQIKPPEPTAVEGIYWFFRKGPYGLSRNSFNMLLLSILFSGLATPYGKGKSISLTQLTAYQLTAIEKVGAGEVLDLSTRQALAECFLLPKRLRQADLSFQRQDEVWQYLIDWKRATSPELAGLVAKKDEFKSYPSMSNLPWDLINQTLARVEEVLEQIKISYPSREGLNEFVGFCRQNPYLEDYFSRYERLKTFFHQEVQQYLYIAEYISNPALVLPTGNKYERVQFNREALMRLLGTKEALWQEDFASRLNDLFRQFSEEYAPLYLLEHQREKSPERLDIYEEFRKSKTHRLLVLLSKIESISVVNDLVKINRLFSELNSAICDADSRTILKQKPICSCGFHLGQTIDLTPLVRLEEIAAAGLKEYVAMLQEDKYRGKILAFSTGLEAIGKTDLAANLKRFISLPAGAADFFQSLEAILTRELIEGINEALAGKRSHVTRDLDELYENLIDRHFTRDQFHRIVQDWLYQSEGLEEDTLIKIVAHKKLDQANEEEEGLLSQHYPRLVPLYQKAGREHFNFLAWSVYWLKIHNLGREEAGQITGLSVSTWLFLGEELESWTQFLLKQRTDVVQKQIGEIERKIDAEGLRDRFLSLLNLSSQILDAMKVIRKENLFRFCIHEAYENIFKILDHYPERRTKRELHSFAEEQLAKEEAAPYHGALKRFISLESRIGHLERIEDLTSRKAGDWEDLYGKYLAELEMELEFLRAEQKRARLSDNGRWRELRERVERTGARVGEAFTSFYQGLVNLDLIGQEKGPRTILDLTRGSVSSYVRKLKGDYLCYLLLDGMRWDIWSYLKREFFGLQGLDLKVIKEMALWAFYPTTTQVQMDHFQKGLEKKEKSGRGRIETEALGAFSESLKFDQLEIVKFNFIDNKIHSTKDSLEIMAQEVLLQSKLLLQPYLESLPRNSVIVLFADHGFRTNPNWEPSAKYDQPRYIHGGVSPEEVIVPLAILQAP